MPTVNRPVNQAEKTASINEKLQFYGIISAFQNGKVPTNEQIDVALNSFIQSKPISSPSEKLSAEGRELIKDVVDVVEQAKLLLLSKNEGELLQDFIWQTQKITGGSASLPNAPVDKDSAQAHGQEVLDGLRTLGTLLITNGQFRKLLNDATILIRDMAGDAAQNAAQRVNPSGDALAQIDQPADDNTWHDTPDFSKDNMKSQLKGMSKKAPIDEGDLNHAAQRTQQGDPTGGAVHLANQVPDEKVEEGKEAARSKANEYKARTKDYLSSKMPEERRDQTIWRLKKMVVEIQGHPDYQQAISTLLTMAETYGGHAKTVGQDSVGTVKDAHDDNALQTAEKDLKTLLERFANGTSADSLIDSIDQIYRDANNDSQLKQWFKDVDSYIRACLQEQGYIMGDDAKNRWNTLYDRGQYLLRDRYRGHTDRVVDEIRFLGDQFDKDPQNKRFAESVAKLFKDLGNDEAGKSTFKPHLLKDVTEVIAPAVLQHISYVPIPRIEVADQQVEVVIENLVLESDNLTPNLLQIQSHHDFQWGRKGAAKSSRKNDVMLKVSGVQMDLRDVAYYVKRKQGFPSITDTGLADIFLGGTGLSFKIKMATADPKDRQNFFKIADVDIDVKNFNIKLRKSNHKLLFALAKPIMLKALRPALQKALEKAIQQKFTEFDHTLYQIKTEVDRAVEEAKKNPEEAPNIYQEYANAFRRQLTQKKEQAEATKEAVKQKAPAVNVAMTHENLLLPGVKLPGTISAKATEYKELAAKGEKWQSPVFSIGSAKKSSNIPKATKITRKEAAVAGAAAAGVGAGAYAATREDNKPYNEKPYDNTYSEKPTEKPYTDTSYTQNPGYTGGVAAVGGGKTSDYQKGYNQGQKDAHAKGLQNGQTGLTDEAKYVTSI